MVNPLTENPLIASFFDPSGASGLTLEQLKSRRAIAAALAAKSRDYPNTIGKGIFTAGETLGEFFRDRSLDAEERAINQRSASERTRQLSPLDPNVPPPAAPTVGPTSEAPASSSVAALDPEVDLSRSQIAAALESGAAGSRPAPVGIQMASLGSAYASDAGQPGATYGGPSPAGPGASMAEPPDQSPPTPSAPPPAAGLGPSGTPPPTPAMGGGVPPGVDAGRTMATDAVMANQGFNPAGPQVGPPPAPPVQLAQVGGFGGNAMGPPSAPAPATLPGTRPLIPPAAPGDPRPTVPEQYRSPPEAEWQRILGPRQYQQPPEWDPTLLDKYQRARREALRSDVNEKYTREAKDIAEKIAEANKRRFDEAKRLADEETASRRTRRDELERERRAQYKEDTNPANISAHNQAIVDGLIQQRAGRPGAEVRKDMEKSLAETRTAVDRQGDYVMALDAINKGVITGTLGSLRLDAEKAKAWLTGNEAARARATNTEQLFRVMKGNIAQALKGLQPISNYEVALGEQIAAAGNNLEIGTIKQVLLTNMKRGNEAIARYDTDADRYFSGIPGPNREYQSPEIKFYPKRHLERLFADAPRDPTAIEEFNARYGPGAAETVLNRKRLNPNAGYTD